MTISQTATTTLLKRDDRSSMSIPTAAASTSTPGRVNKTSIKRKRLGLSCRECKRRKVKCGRQLPICIRCVEAGCPDQCVYDQVSSIDLSAATAAAATHTLASPADQYASGLALAPNAIHHAPHATYFSSNAGPAHGSIDHDASSRRVQELESRLRDLERVLDGSASLPERSPHSERTNLASLDDFGPLDASATEQLLIPGSSFKTQFYGASHSKSIIANVESFGDVLKDVAASHPVLGLPKWDAQLPWVRRPEPCVDLANLDNILHATLATSEPRCRVLMEYYFRHFEGLYRILHGPSFWRQYHEYWSGSGSCSFAAILLAAMSCARCLYVDEASTYEGDCSTARHESVRWVQLAEAWHDQQSHKHTTLAVLQTKCLAMLSRQVNIIKPKRHYMQAEGLMATAVSIGLHRQPKANSPRIGFFEREMRQRLWATIAELELVGCTERGVPSMAAHLYCDVDPPSNLHDEDFDEGTILEPPELPGKQSTESSFLRAAGQLRPLRHAVTTLVNNPRRHRTLTQVDLNTYHHQITRRLAELPDFSSEPSGKAPLFQACYKMLIDDLLLMLHLPFAFASNAHPAANHSRFICAGSSRSIIELYASLESHGFSQIALLRNNIVRAALCLCLTPPRSTGFESIYPLVPSSEKHVLMERVFAMFAERFLSFGWGSRALWLIVAAACFIPGLDGRSGDGMLSPWKTVMADRVAELIRKVCTFQVGKDPEAGFDETLFAKYVRHIWQTLEPAADEVSARPDEVQQQSGPVSVDGLTFSDLSDMTSMIHGPVTADWNSVSIDEMDFLGLSAA